MWPRLQLLRELLADDGVIFVSIDDEEQAHLKIIMDEIFGEESFVTSFIWKSRVSEDTRAKTGVSNDHEYIICYRKTDGTSLHGTGKDLSKFSNPDNDIRGVWRSADLTGLATKEQRPNLHYDLINPATDINYGCPPKGWRYDPSTMRKKISEERILWPEKSDGRPRHKLFLEEMQSQFKNISSVINFTNTADGSREANQVLGNGIFDFPKPSKLIKELVKQATDKDSIILDSFAGSGTTAHAVLDLNKEDGGSRKFILVEMENYANEVTAERVRRVIKGVPSAKDDKLKAGLGGSFTFANLGEAFDIDKILTGESLPSYSSLAQYVFYTATGESLNGDVTPRSDYFVGESSLFEVYLIYKDDLAFLRSNDSALNQEKLDIITTKKSTKQKLVFATAKYMSQSTLSDHKVVFCQIPYAIHKIAGN